MQCSLSSRLHTRLSMVSGNKTCPGCPSLSAHYHRPCQVAHAQRCRFVSSINLSAPLPPDTTLRGETEDTISDAPSAILQDWIDSNSSTNSQCSLLAQPSSHDHQSLLSLSDTDIPVWVDFPLSTCSSLLQQERLSPTAGPSHVIRHSVIDSWVEMQTPHTCERFLCISSLCISTTAGLHPHRRP